MDTGPVRGWSLLRFAIPALQPAEPDTVARSRETSGLAFLRRLPLAPWQAAVLVLYAGLLALLIPRHEPWFDEAQAWLLARDASIVDLFTHYLRYEGSPGLWHALLLGPAKLGFPYLTLNVLAALAGVVGVFIFLRYSPFPVVIKLLVPFSFFIFYQYAVVARSYALAPFLLFLLAYLYPSKERRPYAFMIVLGLLANVSVQCMLIAGSVLLVHVWDLRTKWRDLNPKLRRDHLVAVGGFAVMALLLVLELWPPSNHQWVKPGINLDLVNFRATVVGMMNHSLTEIGVISLPILAFSLFWFWRRHTLLLFVLPTGVLLLFAAFKYHSVWHEGLLFLTWLFVLWVSLSRAPLKRADRIPHLIVMGSLAVVLVFHVLWSANSFRYDFTRPYSGSKAVAQYIKSQRLENASIYATSFHSMSILPYFSHNIFSDYHDKTGGAFWDWSNRNPMWEISYSSIVRAQPQLIIIGVKFPDDQIFSDYPHLFFPGYKVVGVFPGEIYWKNRRLELDEFVVYRR